MARRTGPSPVERVAMELRQIEAEAAAADSGNRYPLTAVETWNRAAEVLRAGYRHDARRILRVLRERPISELTQPVAPQLATVPPGVDEHGAPLHTCAICGTRGPWGPGWCWYGSWRDVDEGRPYTTVCSDTCRAKHAASLKVEPALVDDGGDER